MTRNTPSLRAVGADEKAPRRRMTIVEAAEAGDRLAELEAMRRRLAKALDDPNCPARDMAALSRRQLEIGREIEAINVAAEQEAQDAGRESAHAEAWDAAAI